MPTEERLPSIIVVEDDPIDRRVIRSRLEQWGPEIRITMKTSGTGGISAVTEGDFDCLLLDLHLPDMSGLEFLQAIQTEGGGTALPVLMLTGESNSESIVSAMKLGAKDYLIKSVENLSVSELRNRILLAMTEWEIDKLKPARVHSGLSGVGDELIRVRQYHKMQQQVAFIRDRLFAESANNRRVIALNASLARNASAVTRQNLALQKQLEKYKQRFPDFS